jgi:protein phosphatase
VGLKRHHNEDSYLCNDALGLYVVADGMGGHLGGERASRMAVEIMERQVAAAAQAAQAEAEPRGALLGRAVVEADRAIYENALGDPALTGMGTTLTAALFQGRRAYLGHVGDSRAYLYRDGRARQLTDDHSWIAEQVRAGLMSPDQAKDSRFKNIITRSVGFEPSVRPDLHDLPLEAGDCYLLCSDGLSNHLGLEEIAQVLTTHFYRDAPAAFVEMANDRGGDDNITCVCIYVGNDS